MHMCIQMSLLMRVLLHVEVNRCFSLLLSIFYFETGSLSELYMLMCHNEHVKVIK